MTLDGHCDSGGVDGGVGVDGVGVGVGEVVGGGVLTASVELAGEAGPSMRPAATTALVRIPAAGNTDDVNSKVYSIDGAPDRANRSVEFLTIFIHER